MVLPLRKANYHTRNLYLIYQGGIAALVVNTFGMHQIINTEPEAGHPIVHTQYRP